MLPMLIKPGTWRLFGHFTRYGAEPAEDRAGREITRGETLDLPSHPHVIATPGHIEAHVALLPRPRRPVRRRHDLHPASDHGRRGPQLMAFNVSDAQALWNRSRAT
jgi:hypothetical protein